VFLCALLQLETLFSQPIGFQLQLQLQSGCLCRVLSSLRLEESVALLWAHVHSLGLEESVARLWAHVHSLRLEEGVALFLVQSRTIIMLNVVNRSLCCCRGC
jgi:hypothetical protein